MTANGINRTPRPPMQVAGAGPALLLLGVIGTGWVGLFLLWAAATAAGEAPALGSPTVEAVVACLRTSSLDPLIGEAGSALVFWLVLSAGTAPLLAGAGLLLWWFGFHRPPFGTPGRSLAGRREYQDMRGRGAVRRAQQLRPSLPADRRQVREQDLGMCLGKLGSQRLFASEEDVVLVIAGPRSNKTSAEVVPAVLSAPGPVIATSNKVDLYTITVALRAQLGQVFVFDPQHIAGAQQTWWWNPLAGIRDMADAQHLVAHFSQTVGAGHERADPYFTRGAERLLGQLLVAAAHGGRDSAHGLGEQYSLRDVRRWLATRSEEPVELLSAAELHDVAEGLQGTLEAPPDQRGGLYETALTSIAALESEAVARYVTPPSTWLDPPQGPIEEFDPWRFIVGYNDVDGVPQPYDTLYLLTREGAGTGAPVVAALVDHLLRTTSAAATARGGRVDPPVRAVLDEAANICPIRNLPDLYSYFGSMSIQVMSFLQSYQQGVAIWGKAGMDKLWGAATIKLIGAGVHDPSFCEDLSRLIGDHDVPTWSDQHGRHRSTTTSTRRDRILSAAAIAALPKTLAVLISSGRRPGVIELLPWYREPDADQIGAHAKAAGEEVRQAAITELGPGNPLAKLLQQEQARSNRGP